MKTVVITGSTRGIGFGMAQEFLRQGCQVVVNGRTDEAVTQAVQQLSAIAGSEHVYGCAGNSASPADLENLWQEAKKFFGRVDIWINNAGISNRLGDFWTLETEDLRRTVETNILGSMYGSRVAIRGMLEQGGGAVYNLEGLGSDNGRRKVRGLAPYGTTKAALRYFDEALMKEVEGTPVILGALQPGMVFTDMISRQYENSSQEQEKNRRIVTILSQPVEVVAPWLAQRILENQKNGARIQYGSFFKIMLRFIRAGFAKK